MTNLERANNLFQVLGALPDRDINRIAAALDDAERRGEKRVLDLCRRAMNAAIRQQARRKKK